MKRFLEKVRRSGTDTCWVWVGAKLPSGYGTFCLNGSAVHKIGAHVAAYILFNGNYDNALDVSHVCDVPWCVNPDHLIQQTHGENMRDSIRRGRHPTLGKSGACNCNSVLTQEKVDAIRAARGSATYTDIAAKFNVSRSTVRDIFIGRTWKHGHTESAKVS